MRFGTRPPAPRLMLLVRASGVVMLAIVIMALPEVGEHRFLLGTLVLAVLVPLGIVIEMRFPTEVTGWSQPLLDLSAVVLLVHLTPGQWHAALALGTLVASAQSMRSSPSSWRVFAGLGVLLLAGMSFAGWLHDVDGWVIPILALSVVYPPAVYYARLQALRSIELTHRSQLLGNLELVAGGVAHDFNNILTGVVGHAEVAMSQLPVDHPARESIAAAVASAQRAGLLSRELLMFSGRRAREHIAVDLAAQVREVVRGQQHALPAGVAVEVETEPGGTFLMGDPAQIQQVVANLLINAAQASAAGKSAVRVRVFEHTLHGQPGVVLEVIDRGPGIPAEFVDRITEPFFSLKPDGQGLGLATVDRVVRRHGGTLEVISSPGSGTTVRVAFPAVAGPVDDAGVGVPGGPAGEPLRPVAAVPGGQSDAGPAAASDRGRSPPPVAVATPPCVLVVDDEPGIRAVVERQLVRRGWTCVLAADGDAAVAAFDAEPDRFDAALLDLKLPGMDGWAVLGHIRLRRPSLPVVLSSGFDPAAGALDPDDKHVTFLAKPYMAAELFDALQRVAPGLP